MKLMKPTDGSCRIIVRSMRRVRLAGFETINGQWVAETEKPAEDRAAGSEVEAFVFSLRTQFEKFASRASVPAELCVVALKDPVDVPGHL